MFWSKRIFVRCRLATAIWCCILSAAQQFTACCLSGEAGPDAHISITNRLELFNAVVSDDCVEGTEETVQFVDENARLGVFGKAGEIYEIGKQYRDRWMVLRLTRPGRSGFGCNLAAGCRGSDFRDLSFSSVKRLLGFLGSKSLRLNSS